MLPAQPDDQPLILPGEEAFKFAGEPQVLPGAEELVLDAPLFLNLEARMAFVGDWMITLDPDGGPTNTPAYRDDFGLG